MTIRHSLITAFSSNEGNDPQIHEITPTKFRVRSCDFVERGLSQNLAQNIRKQAFVLKEVAQRLEFLPTDSYPTPRIPKIT